jgi:hypothetical protein
MSDKDVEEFLKNESDHEEEHGDNIDELLKQLNPTATPVNPETPIEAPVVAKSSEVDISDENVGDFVLQNAAQLVKSGVDTIESLKDSVLNAVEADEIAALSEVMRATNSSIDTLNKINIQNKKEKAAKDLKQMDIDNQKNLPAGTSGNVNVLVATRSEIMDKILSGEDVDVSGAETIDGEYEEIKDEE